MDNQVNQQTSPIPPLAPTPQDETVPPAQTAPTDTPPIIAQASTVPVTSNAPPPSGGKRRVFVLGAILCGVVVVVGAIAYLMMSPKKQGQDQKTETKQQKMAKEKSEADKFFEKAGVKAPAFPKTTVAQWDTAGVVMSQSVPTAKSYSFVEPNKALFQSIATQLMPSANLNIEENADRFVTDVNSAESDMMLYMQKEQGYFLFKVMGPGPELPTATPDERANVSALVQKMFNDTSINISATYQKSHVEGVTYYEAHRSWNSVGLPILNTLGLFNIPTTISLNSLTDVPNATLIAQLGSDPNIVRTSDGADGKLRQNEFNTITVGIKDGQIVSILSNMRMIDAAKSVSNEQLLTNNQAVERLTKGQHENLYISPAGEGIVDENKLTPNNQAQLTTAKVVEGRSVYLESVGGTQKQLLPYYIFRGTGVLDSGYDVRFLATVPATNTPVLGANTIATNQTQQQGTLEFPANSSTGTATPNTTTKQQTTTDTEPLKQTTTKGTSFTPCYGENDDDSPNREQLSNLRSDNAGNEYGQYLGQLGSNKGEMLWFVILKTKTLAALENAIDYAAANLGVARRGTDLGSQYKEEDGGSDRVIRNMTEIRKDFEDTQGSCPVRLTGTSPTMFVYSDTHTKLDMSIDTDLTYAQPAQTDNAWSVQAGSQLLVNGENTPYIYYEYTPINWTRPNVGWNTSRSALDKLGQNIARQLGLNETEPKRLVYELRHAAAELKSEALYVGLIPQSSVEENLPLTLSTTPDRLYRYHFFIGQGQNNSATTPELQKIERNGLTILELGATPGK